MPAKKLEVWERIDIAMELVRAMVRKNEIGGFKIFQPSCYLGDGVKAYTQLNGEHLKVEEDGTITKSRPDMLHGGILDEIIEEVTK